MKVDDKKEELKAAVLKAKALNSRAPVVALLNVYKKGDLGQYKKATKDILDKDAKVEDIVENLCDKFNSIFGQEKEEPQQPKETVVSAESKGNASKKGFMGKLTGN